MGQFLGSEREWNELRDEHRSLHSLIRQVLSNQEKFMSQVDDLNGAVVGLTNGFAALDASVQPVVAFVLAQPGLSSAVTSAVKSIGDVTNKMAADAAELTSALPAATTVSPPTPTPTPTPTPVAAPVTITAPPVAAPVVPPS